MLGFAVVASAGEYLEPDDTLISVQKRSSYKQMVLDALSPALDRSVKIRAFVFPSFYPEYVIGLREFEDGHKLFKLEPEIQLWGFEHLKLSKKSYVKGKSAAADDFVAKQEAALPRSYKQVKINRCEVGIKSELAEQLIKVWEVMLLSTYHTAYNGAGLDGVYYHFSMRHNERTLAGMIWSPQERSNAGRLVAISDTMKALCERPSDDLVHQLRRLANSLHSMRKEWSATSRGQLNGDRK